MRFKSDGNYNIIDTETLNQWHISNGDFQQLLDLLNELDGLVKAHENNIGKLSEFISSKGLTLDDFNEFIMKDVVIYGWDE